MIAARISFRRRVQITCTNCEQIARPGLPFGGQMRPSYSCAIPDFPMSRQGIPEDSWVKSAIGEWPVSTIGRGNAGSLAFALRRGGTRRRLVSWPRCLPDPRAARASRGESICCKPQGTLTELYCGIAVPAVETPVPHFVLLSAVSSSAACRRASRTSPAIG